MATTRDYDRVVTSYYDPKVVDQTFKTTPLLNRFYGKAKVSNFNPKGILETLETGTGIAGTFVDIEQVDTSRAEILGQATYVAKNYYAALNVSFVDEMVWGSPEAMVEGMDIKMKNATKTLRSNLTTDLISGDGTTNNIYGLHQAIAYTATTYAGLAEATYTYWVPQRKNISSTTITLPDIMDLCVKCSDGSDKPTILVTDKFIWAYVWANLIQPSERYTAGTANMITAFPEVMGYPILHDAGMESAGATSGYMFAINENYLFLRIHSKNNMKRWPMEKPHAQFAYSTYWTLTLSLCCTNRKKQGVAYGITTS